MNPPDKAIAMHQLRPMGLSAPGRLSDVDSYEIYVRITPIRFYDVTGTDGSVERAEKRGESFGCASWVAQVHSKESGLLLHLIRQMLYQVVESFMDVRTIRSMRARRRHRRRPLIRSRPTIFLSEP